MNDTTLSALILLCTLVLVIGGGVLIYVGSLAKSAYQLRVELQTNLDNGLHRLDEEIQKNLRAVQRELNGEVEKSRMAAQSDSARKVHDAAERLEKRLVEIENRVNGERADVGRMVEVLRRELEALDQSLLSLRREVHASKTRVNVASDSSSTPSSAATTSLRSTM